MSGTSSQHPRPARRLQPVIDTPGDRPQNSRREQRVALHRPQKDPAAQSRERHTPEVEDPPRGYTGNQRRKPPRSGPEKDRPRKVAYKHGSGLYSPAAGHRLFLITFTAKSLPEKGARLVQRVDLPPAPDIYVVEAGRFATSEEPKGVAEPERVISPTTLT